jgi:hypothetical protein
MEGGVEHRHVRDVRERPLGDLDAFGVDGVVQRREHGEIADRGQHGVVDQHRRREPLAAVDDAVRDRRELSERRLEREHRVERGGVIGERAIDDLGAVAQAPGRRADPLDHPGDHRRAGVHVDHRVLQRRRAAIDDEDPHWDWIAVIATVLMMSCTVAPRERSLTGWLSPCRTGPMAIAPALRWTAL